MIVYYSCAHTGNTIPRKARVFASVPCARPLRGGRREPRRFQCRRRLLQARVGLAALSGCVSKWIPGLGSLTRAPCTGNRYIGARVCRSESDPRSRGSVMPSQSRSETGLGSSWALQVGRATAADVGRRCRSWWTRGSPGSSGAVPRNGGLATARSWSRTISMNIARS